MFQTDRRLLLAAFSAALVPPPLARALAAVTTGSGTSGGPRLGPPRPFGFRTLIEDAQKRATRPYQPPTPPAAHIGQIDFDTVQKITFRPDHALWRGQATQDPVRFFSLNRYANQPVDLYAIKNGQARPILYGADYFAYAGSGLDANALSGLGFSGFRVMDGQNAATDWLAFQGASYFRSSGQDGQYGASARGLAINTGLPEPEEFPRFTSFWLAPHTDGITVFAALDGPSVSGAYRFEVVKKETVVMDVNAHLFFRKAVTRLGLAPLTSMYWYGENQRDKAVDWRPEIHDSDGLALWTGKGERIWRPLINPPHVQTNSFLDDGPKGFGLMQRDRNFDHYQDDGAFYNKRPGIWVEPKGTWGKGAVQLVEIPTDDETNDNIVAFWNPAQAVKAHEHMALSYRLYWQDQIPGYPPTIAKVVATRLGRGGPPGVVPWPRDTTKFVVDFEGGPLTAMAQRYDVEPVASASQGTIKDGYVVKVVGTNRWRALFDLKHDGTKPIDLRLFLRLNGKTLSETWLYQYFPAG